MNGPPEYAPIFDEITFEDEIVENPFRDPAVKEAVLGSPEFIKVDTYEPLRSKQTSMHGGDGYRNTGSVSPAESTSLYTSVDLEVPAEDAKFSTKELLRKQEELERKEEELARKEEELLKGAYNQHQNNWPPLPKFCCFQPCFYQDIDLEIPPEFQDVVKKLYKVWVFHEVIMTLNVFGGLLLLDFSVIGLGVLYFLLYTPFSYVCWFRTAYKGFRTDSSINFMAFFFMFFLQFVITCMQALGVPGSGTIGLIMAFKSFTGTKWGIFRGLLNLAIASGFCFAAIADFVLIGKVHRIYRNTGASFAKAQQEFATSFLQSEYVRNASQNNATRRN